MLVSANTKLHAQLHYCMGTRFWTVNITEQVDCISLFSKMTSSAEACSSSTSRTTVGLQTKCSVV